ncbi:extensin family protein [Aestuariivita boseongensis]|uniref:extensin-like domain-containing protein n=1 Tax=Aestuariivita boseongensis TaxID=1470562 RepID=UPI00068282B5|nr:extensin family protein [Aestuariivita boseongensis]
MRRAWLGLLTVLLVSPVLAKAPDTSLRPQPRVLNHPGIVLLPTEPLVRPRARPVSEQIASASSRGTLALLAPVQSFRPNLRPPSVIREAMSRKRQARRGMVCESTDIQGEVVGFVPGRIPGCGIEDAVRVKSVSGVALSQQALMDCNTAKALNRWVNNGAKPALRSKGRLVELRVAAHYACRTRNNQPGARISEHGKGRAIDISGFRMDDGQVITVLNHWDARGFRTAMRKMHRTACGPFGTVLGPDSDRFHRDHFHFDTAKYRSGPFCR